MSETQSRKSILITAWVVILAVSLFKIVLQEIFKVSVSENLQYMVSGLIVVAGLALTFVWKDIRPLRPFFGLFIVLFLTQWLIFTQVDNLPVFQSWLHNPSFSVSMLAEQFLKLLVTLVVIVFLFFVKKRRERFFLAKGNPSAPIGPVRWLGIKAGDKWHPAGWIIAGCISLGTLAFLVIAGRPPLDIFVKVVPFIPAVLLAAALNAFYEEMSYKASFLSVLEDVTGPRQALWLMAAFFGIFHYYGVPYGIIGVILAGFLGWLLGKSMLETRGMFWAWFIHFVQDVLIFLFLSIGSITPGG